MIVHYLLCGMSQHTTVSSAFEELRRYYDHAERACPKCGYRDEGGAWRASVDAPGAVHYQHVCPSCGAVHSHDLRYG